MDNLMLFYPLIVLLFFIFFDVRNRKKRPAPPPQQHNQQQKKQRKQQRRHQQQKLQRLRHLQMETHSQFGAGIQHLIFMQWNRQQKFIKKKIQILS